MKYNFICIDKHDNIFEDMQNPPFECSVCRMDYDESRVVQAIVEKVMFEYEKTGFSFEVVLDTKNQVLGRDGIGAEIFNSILNANNQPLISRRHCSVWAAEEIVYIKDEGSTNGTFLGEEQLRVSVIPQVMLDGQILFFGKERFKVSFAYTQSETHINQHINQENQSPSVPEEVFYQCGNCLYHSKENIQICPQCDSFNSFVVVRGKID